MRIVRRRRAIHRVAARVRRHRHHAHAVRQPSIHRLQVLVVEGFGQQHRRNRFHKLRIGHRAVLGLVRRNAPLGVLHVFAAQAHHQVQDGLPQQRVLCGFFSFSAASLAAPVFSNSPAFSTKRSLLAWNTGRM
jgi:hypothetical protein